MTGAPLARRERRGLCDLALALGEDAPTLCGDWTAKDLVAHLLVRDYSPLAGIGLVVPRLEWLAEREMARVGRRDFAVLVEQLRRRGPTVMSLAPVDRLLNTMEYVIHHEDLRRAQPGWTPRELPVADQDSLWPSVRHYGKGLVRPAGVPLVARRTDTGATATLRAGDDPVVVAGLPTEIALFVFGRQQVAEVELSGPPERVAALQDASLGG